jgi:hypothetical protein
MQFSITTEVDAPPDVVFCPPVLLSVSTGPLTMPGFRTGW